jgi:MYXO-CTERM domain-containing protein
MVAAMRRTATVAVFVGVVFGFGTPAGAQSGNDNGVEVKQGSPAGKEYSIPASAGGGTPKKAKKSGSSTSGSGSSSSSGTGSGVGAGIKPASTTSSGEQGSSTGSSGQSSATGSGGQSTSGSNGARHLKRRTRDHTVPTATPRLGESDVRRAPPALVHSHAADSGSSPWIPIGIGVGVVALGLGAGLFVRRRLHDAPA